MKAVVIVALLACAAAVSMDRTLVGKRTAVSSGWVRAEKAPAWARVRFTIGLRQHNLHALEQLFWGVSTPGSPTYQQYLSIKEIQALVSPPPAEQEAVLTWLHGNGVTAGVENLGDAVAVTTNVGLAARLFQTDFHVFKHEKSGRRVIRIWGEASIPTKLKGTVQLVEGLTAFPTPHLTLKRSNDQYAVIPQTLQQLYHIPAQQQGKAPQTSVGVIEFEGQNFSPDDLQTYAQGVNIGITPLTDDHIIGPNQGDQPQVEAELDIQFAAGVNDAATPWFWLEQGNNWLWSFALHYFSTQDVPQVSSVSYAWSEMDNCQINPQECQDLGVDSQGYVQRVNTEWQKIGARGLTLLVASGDSGANGRTDEQCVDPYLKPDYPASSPFVTSVGGTQLNDPKTNLQNPPPVCSQGSFTCVSGGNEVAVSYDVSNYASGGGFAVWSPMPSYQTSDVNAFLASGSTLPPDSYYNKTNRGFPDISAVGHDCLIYTQGQWMSVGGTSCAAPIWAGIVSIVNQYVIKKTGKPLGFLNPWLYKMHQECPTCFIDITQGDNLCTEGGCSSSCEGFYCAKGWDPVTGLGSPNVANIIKYVQK